MRGNYSNLKIMELPIGAILAFTKRIYLSLPLGIKHRKVLP